MNCPSCGFANEGTPKFCMKCGTAQQTPVQPVNNVDMNQQQVAAPQNMTDNFVAEQNMNNNQNMNQQPMNNQMPGFTPQPVGGPLNYFAFIFAVLLKPVTAIKEEINKFSDTKTSFIFATLTAGIMTVATILTTIIAMIALMRAFGGFEFSFFGHLPWAQLIFRNFFVYAGIIFAIAGAYWLAAMIVKKTPDFKKLLGISALSMLPVAGLTLLLGPIAANLWGNFLIIFGIAGVFYSLIILLYGMNRELNLEDNDTKIYVNAGVLSTLLIIAYFIAARTAMGILGMSLF